MHLAKKVPLVLTHGHIGGPHTSHRQVLASRGNALRFVHFSPLLRALFTPLATRNLSLGPRRLSGEINPWASLLVRLGGKREVKGRPNHSRFPDVYGLILFSFFPTIVLFETEDFPWVSGGFLERGSLERMEMEGGTRRLDMEVEAGANKS